MLYVPPSVCTSIWSPCSYLAKGGICVLSHYAVFSSVFLLLILGLCYRKQDIGEGKGKVCDRRVLCGGWRKLNKWMHCIGFVITVVDRIYCWGDSFNLLTRWENFISGERERVLVRCRKATSRWTENEKEWQHVCMYVCMYVYIYSIILSISHFIHAGIKSEIQEPVLLNYYALSLCV